ncbi:MAG TPA: flagellar motor switch protein FliN [Bacteroidetes bacterium]|nr:flagellar motor switch protein FliN [Bacteroidota bacterium]
METQDMIEQPATGEKKEIKMDMLMDLNLQVSIELGRTKMLIKDILELNRGAVIELEKLASEPVDILVNGKKVAEGEVVVIEKHFGIRITNLIDNMERLKSIGG